MMIELHIDYIKNVNYALLHNHIPVCSSIELANVSEEDLLDISVSIGGRFLQEQRSAIYSRIYIVVLIVEARYVFLMSLFSPRLMLCLSSQSASSPPSLYRSIVGKKSCFRGSMTWS